jgi:hypothetical protein
MSHFCSHSLFLQKLTSTNQNVKTPTTLLNLNVLIGGGWFLQKLRMEPKMWHAVYYWYFIFSKIILLNFQIKARQLIFSIKIIWHLVRGYPFVVTVFWDRNILHYTAATDPNKQMIQNILIAPDRKIFCR